MAFPEPRLDPTDNLDAALEADAAQTRRDAAALAIRNARKAALAADVRRGLAIVGQAAWAIGKPLGEAAIETALAGFGLQPAAVPIVAALVGRVESGLEGEIESHLAGGAA